MTQVYTQDDQNKAQKKRKSLILLWGVSFAVFVLTVTFFVVYNLYRVSAHNDRGTHVLFCTLTILLSCAFCCFSYFLFSTKLKLITNYTKLFKDASSASLPLDEVTFVEIDESVVTNLGIEFITLVVQAKPLKRIDITTRNILLDKNAIRPDFEVGDRLRVKTFSNILLSYEKINGENYEN